jgi:septum formation protein
MSSKKSHPDRLILASASPRRRELLERMGLSFDVFPTDVAETESIEAGPDGMVAFNAALKADFLQEKFPNSLMLGSDTTVAHQGIALGKPKNHNEANLMLQQLSGNTHTVFTAVSLRWLAESFTLDFVERSEVTFKPLNEKTIRHYHHLVNPLDKAGAYGIQEGRELIIDSVDGSVENVMGLPIQKLFKVFKEQAFDFSFHI